MCRGLSEDSILAFVISDDAVAASHGVGFGHEPDTVDTASQAVASQSVLAVALMPDERSVIRECLSSSAIELREVHSVEDALQQVLPSAPVVLYDADARRDWQKPLKQFLQRWPGARVVFLSRLPDEHRWVDMLEAGAYDLLLKPFQRAEISWIVRGALLNSVMTSAAYR